MNSDDAWNMFVVILLFHAFSIICIKLKTNFFQAFVVYELNLLLLYLELL